MRIVTVTLHINTTYRTKKLLRFLQETYNFQDGLSFAERQREIDDKEKLPTLISKALGKYDAVNYTYSQLKSDKTLIWVDQTKKEVY